jgi:hypothetical protein
MIRYSGKELFNGQNRKSILILFYLPRYVGSIKDFRAEGAGKKQYSNGDVYIGQWHSGLRHGKGKQIFSNGNIYEGDWIEDKQNG